MTPAERESVEALDVRLRADLAAAGSEDALAERNRQSARDAALAIYLRLGWRDLGFPSWPAYLADVGHSDDLRPPSREQRRAVVAVMDGQGMAQKAIARELGVSESTISMTVREKFGTELLPQVSRRQAAREKRDRHILEYLDKNRRATSRDVARAVGCDQKTVTEAAKRLGHVWANGPGGQRKSSAVVASSPSSDPLWLRAPEFGDLRSIARIVAVMKERNSRTHMAQNVTDAIAAGDTEFVNEHARAAAEVAEYAAELLAVFSDADYRADLNRGIPGRTDHNYRPPMRLASVG